MLKATILIDNLSHGPLLCEWGLAIYINYQGKTILLDAGASGQFAENAAMLGMDLSVVDYAVLSHAHFDHADGMDTFFHANQQAKLYVQKDCGENCYSFKDGKYTYIGIKQGLLQRYTDRIVYVDGDCQLSEGVHLIAHKQATRTRKNNVNGQFIREQRKYRPDDYAHEQSLVFETEQGLVIFNSCCHGGAEQIIDEVKISFPGKPIKALIGGLHLFQREPEAVLELADVLEKTGLEKLYTGHCTGNSACDMLKSVMGDKVEILAAGMVISL